MLLRLISAGVLSHLPIDPSNDVKQAGDTSDGLEIASSDALDLKGATIKRVSTSPSQDANLVFSSGDDDGEGTQGLYGFSLRGDGEDGDDSSSADLPPVVIDCSEAPTVLSVTATAFAGEYGAGQRIYFQVCMIAVVEELGIFCCTRALHEYLLLRSGCCLPARHALIKHFFCLIHKQVVFSIDVIVDEDGSPELLLETGAEDRAATFYTGNGTSTLTFRSTVQVWFCV